MISLHKTYQKDWSFTTHVFSTSCNYYYCYFYKITNSRNNTSIICSK